METPELKPEQKIVIIRRAPSLGEHDFYAITYTRDGDITGKSIARADEIDAWRKDLIETGWTLSEPAAPEPDPSDPRQIAIKLIHQNIREGAMRHVRIAVAEHYDLKDLGRNGYAAKCEEVREHIARATVTVEIPDEATS